MGELFHCDLLILIEVRVRVGYVDVNVVGCLMRGPGICAQGTHGHAAALLLSE